jgi:hypothetical protein
LLPKPLGNEKLNALSDQFIAPMVEHLLGQPIDADDATALIDDDGRVWRRFKESLEERIEPVHGEET